MVSDLYRMYERSKYKYVTIDYMSYRVIKTSTYDLVIPSDICLWNISGDLQQAGKSGM
jgi:hypothetical protein